MKNIAACLMHLPLLFFALLLSNCRDVNAEAIEVVQVGGGTVAGFKIATGETINANDIAALKRKGSRLWMKYVSKTDGKFKTLQGEVSNLGDLEFPSHFKRFQNGTMVNSLYAYEVKFMNKLKDLSNQENSLYLVSGLMDDGKPIDEMRIPFSEKDRTTVKEMMREQWISRGIDDLKKSKRLEGALQRALAKKTVFNRRNLKKILK